MLKFMHLICVCFFHSGCKKLDLTEPETLKLFSTQGVLLDDDDIQDEDWIKEETVIISSIPPSPVYRPPSRSATPLPVMPSLSREATDDTLSVASFTSSQSTSEISSQSSDVSAEVSSLPVKLPTFSNALDTKLKVFANKTCDLEAWRLVRKLKNSFLSLFEKEIGQKATVLF